MGARGVAAAFSITFSGLAAPMLFWPVVRQGPELRRPNALRDLYETGRSLRAGA